MLSTPLTALHTPLLRALLLAVSAVLLVACTTEVGGGRSPAGPDAGATSDGSEATPDTSTVIPQPDPGPTQDEGPRGEPDTGEPAGCTEANADKVCDDQNGCTLDACDPVWGKCIHSPQKDGKACDADGDGCTQGDLCDHGKCVVGQAVACPDAGGVCHVAVCSSLGPNAYDCLTTPGPAGVECSDGKLCTEGDACGADGACLPGPHLEGCCEGPADCDDDNACTLDTCSVMSNECSWMAAPDETPCGGEPGDCVDEGICMAGECDPGPPRPPGTGCEDGDPCTLGDVCDGEGGCLTGGEEAENCCTEPAHCDDQNPCSLDTCDYETDQCVHADAPDGMECLADEDGCTTDDHCTEGACVPGSPAVCPDSTTPCWDNVCVSKTAEVHDCEQVPSAAGAACEDGDVCTANQCDGEGACTASAIAGCCKKNVDCDDKNDCTPNVCSLDTHTCKFPPSKDGTECNDKSVCTIGDSCEGGQCKPGTTPLDCDDGNVCTTPKCDPTLGCNQQYNTVSCDDGEVCTVTDTCAGGACSGQAKSCDDKNKCTDDSCLNGVGCQNKPNTFSEACFDGPAGKGGVGECKMGTHSCQGGVFGPCYGQKLPQSEVCDQKDNDCNGKIDDGGVCCLEQGQYCAGGGGSCCSGICNVNCCMVTCPPDKWVCNGQNREYWDYSCNSSGGCTYQVTQSQPGGNPCTVSGQSGPCAQGKFMCQGSNFVCVQTTYPSGEVCDGADNNCNGQTDEGGVCGPNLFYSAKLGTYDSGTCQSLGGVWASGSKCWSKSQLKYTTMGAYDSGTCKSIGGVWGSGSKCWFAGGGGSTVGSVLESKQSSSVQSSYAPSPAQMATYDSGVCSSLGGSWASGSKCYYTSGMMYGVGMGTYDSGTCTSLGGKWGYGSKCWTKNNQLSATTMGTYDSGTCTSLGGKWSSGAKCWTNSGKAIYYATMGTYDSGSCSQLGGKWGSGGKCWHVP